MMGQQSKIEVKVVNRYFTTDMRELKLAAGHGIGDFEELAAEQVAIHKRETELRECPKVIPPDEPVQIMDADGTIVWFNHAVKFVLRRHWLWGEYWEKQLAGMISWRSGGYTVGAATPFLNPFPKSPEAIRERNEFINSFVNG